MRGKFYAVFLAGGCGSRMGADKPKQFLEIGGKPILRIAIEKFISVFDDVSIVTVLPEDFIPYWKKYCIEKNFYYPQTLVKGGITRFHSVRNALKKIPDGAVVAIHDGVRPFVSAGLLKEMYERMSSSPAVIPVIPVVDTLRALLKSSDGEYQVLGEELDRTRIYSVQTPQFFHSELIKEAYNQAYDMSFTDDSSVAQKKNIPLSFVEGERNNIKITTRSDLELAEAILSL